MRPLYPPPGFEEIYAKYKSYFVRIAMSYVWDRMTAEDIVTDSFVVFWANRHDLTSGISPPISIR